MKLEVGIDLGTTNTAVAYLKNGAIEHLKFRNKDNLPSTMIYINHKITIGEIAKRKSATLTSTVSGNDSVVLQKSVYSLKSVIVVYSIINGWPYELLFELCV